MDEFTGPPRIIWVFDAFLAAAGIIIICVTVKLLRKVCCSNEPVSYVIATNVTDTHRYTEARVLPVEPAPSYGSLFSGPTNVTRASTCTETKVHIPPALAYGSADAPPPAYDQISAVGRSSAKLGIRTPPRCNSPKRG